LKILGIDPGYQLLGWSVIDSNFKLLDFGIIHTETALPIQERLFIIHKGLSEIISLYKPQSAAFERIFFSRNTKTAMNVAYSIGTIMLTLRMEGLEFSEYTPIQVKKSVTGFGRASKEQVREMIMRLFNLKEISGPDDAVDAIAIAACHSMNWKGNIRGK